MPTGSLPKAGKKIWESVYNEAKASGAGKESAAKQAWGAVKHSWKKVDGKWVKKSELIAEASMYITKAFQDGKVMRWSAINSDTDPDSYTERMSYELYQDFIGRIKRNEPVPEIFRNAVCSEWWDGGMPYLSVSHYPDLNGQAVPGEPVEIFIDGDVKKARLKAKGVLHNSPLGHSVFRSLQEDKNKNPDDRIRISIGFLDLAHRHGDGELWIRESLVSLCPECLEGVGQKTYVKGYLVHLALTRVPVNKRTEMVLEEKSMATKAKKTRKEDAASIVGASLAEEIDAKSRVSTTRSDALIEMSESETPEETQELIEEVEVAKSEEVSDVVETPVTSVAPAEPVVEESKHADEEHKKTEEEMGEMEEEHEKKMGKKSETEDFESQVLEMLKSLTEKAFAVPSVEVKSESVQYHALKPALDALLSAVDNSIELEGDINQKLQFVNPSLQELGTAITDYVSQKSVAIEEPAPDKNNDNLLEKITELIQPISQSVQQLSEKVGVLEAKSNAGAVQAKSRIPQPRTLSASVAQKAEVSTPKPGSLKDIARRSVGIIE